ncbi:MAG: glutathione S-transferase family protein [Bradymonadia bacterium]
MNAPTPQTVDLYQFELCPYCHKVKAGLEVKGIPYRKIEVNPMGKKELPADLPEDAPKKVPVIKVGGELRYDSPVILRFLEEAYPDTRSLTPTDEAAKEKSDMVEKWVDDEVCYALPTVIYGTWGEAAKAAQVTARTSNFGFFQNMTVRAGGSLIMHQISKRILKKKGRTDGHAWVNETVDQFEEWLGKQPFVTGDEISLGDVAMHGALTCVKDFPIFSKIMARPLTKAWYDRVSAMRQRA